MKTISLTIAISFTSLVSFSQTYYGMYEKDLPTNSSNKRLNEIKSQYGKTPGVWMRFMRVGNDLDVTGCNALLAQGITPMITLEPYNDTITGKYYGQYDNVIAGNYDDYWRKFADQVKQVKGTIFLRYAHEMNGNWYDWDGYHNKKNSYAPKKYVLAWQHIYNIIKTQKQVTNILWNWCTNGGSVPNETWNQHVNYYPGDAYVDWIGFDSYDKPYNYTPTRYQTVAQTFGTVYAKLSSIAPDKPILIAEFASENDSNETDPHKADFFSQGGDLFDNYPRVHAFSYFNVAKFNSGRWNNYMINNPAELLPIFKANWIDNVNVSSGNVGIETIHLYKAIPITGSLKTEAEYYFDHSGIKNQVCSEGGLNVAYTTTGDFMDYLIDVPVTGTYTCSLRVATTSTTSKIEFRNQAGNVLGSYAQTNSTGDWQTWQTNTMTLNLVAGKQKLRIYYTGGGLNLNWFEIKKTQVLPVVSFTNLTNNQQIALGTDLNINVSATHASGIDSVKLYVDDVFLRKETIAPYDWGLGANDPSLNTLTPGQHTIKAIATATSGEVSETSVSITIVKIVTGIETERVEYFNIYPNPVTDIIHLTIETDWELVNVSGLLIMSGSGNTVNTSGLAKGVFFLKAKGSVYKILII